MEFIPIAKPYIGPEEAEAVYEQIKSGWITMGKRVAHFEQMLREYVGVRHAIAFSDGTAALHAALIALGVGPGDEVLVPSLSYVSSANVVVFCGAKPVFVEEDEQTFNVAPETIRKAITPKTKAIITVDLKGLPVDYDAMSEVFADTGIPILADSAESFGARYKHKPVGGQAPVHAFSMFANKSITAGEGGFVTTDDNELARKCRCICNQGQAERYVHVMIGHNYRLTDMAAAFAIEQFKRVEWFMAQKEQIAAFYNHAFEGNALLTVPHVPAYATRPSWYMYCLRVAHEVDRDVMIRLMREQGVDHRLSFPPIPLQPIYREMYGYKPGDFPVAEAIFQHFVDIPIWVGMTSSDMEKVSEVVARSAEQARR